MSKTITIEDVLEDIEHLNTEDQKYIVELVSKRLIDKKRGEISKRAKEAEKNYKKGKSKRGKFEDIWEDLNG
jgi:hypothetical protein